MQTSQRFKILKAALPPYSYIITKLSVKLLGNIHSSTTAWAFLPPSEVWQAEVSWRSHTSLASLDNPASATLQFCQLSAPITWLPVKIFPKATGDQGIHIVPVLLAATKKIVSKWPTLD